MQKLAAIEKIEAMGLDAFIAEYKLHAVRSDGLVSLKYNQIESPMYEPCVADCRGLVVEEANPSRIVAMAYRKFWNLGEKHADPIDWSTARVAEKLDGSLMTMYWHDGRWCVASSGHPTAGGSYGAADVTFRDVFWETFGLLDYALPRPSDRSVWFIFELCRADNRIVVKYDRPRLVLHGARHSAGREFGPSALQDIADDYGWEVVRSWSPAEATPEWVAASAASTDPLALEGYVVTDAAFRRVKVKNPRYVEIHHLRGNRSPRSVVELWKAGEIGEVLTHFPEMRPDFDAVTEPLESHIANVTAAWAENQNVTNRKEFAMAVKTLPLNACLFRMFTDRPDGDPAEHVRSTVRGMTTQAILRAVGAE